MSRVDSLTGRGPSTGNHRSHSLRASRRTWNVNLQWATVTINGKKARLRVSAKTLKTLRKAQKHVAPVAQPTADQVAAAEAPAPVAAPAAPAAK